MSFSWSPKIVVKMVTGNLSQGGLVISITVTFSDGTTEFHLVPVQVVQEIASAYNLIKSGNTYQIAMPAVSCKQLTITNAQGISRFFKLTETEIRTLLTEQYPNTTFSPSFESPDCEGKDDLIVAIDFIQTALLLPITVVQFTATNDQGISQFFKTRQSDYDILKEQFPNNISQAFPTTDTEGVQDKIIVQDFILTSQIPPPPTGLVNNLVIVQTQCGSQRVIMTDQELQSFQMGNFLPAPAPSTLTYSVSGKVNDPSSYDQFLVFAARCYNVTIPIPSRGVIGGSLFGITMFLMALGTLISGKLGK